MFQTWIPSAMCSLPTSVLNNVSRGPIIGDALNNSIKFIFMVSNILSHVLGVYLSLDPDFLDDLPYLSNTKI